MAKESKLSPTEKYLEWKRKLWASSPDKHRGPKTCAWCRYFEPYIGAHGRTPYVAPRKPEPRPDNWGPNLFTWRMSFGHWDGHESMESFVSRLEAAERGSCTYGGPPQMTGRDDTCRRWEELTPEQREAMEEKDKLWAASNTP